MDAELNEAYYRHKADRLERTDFWTRLVAFGFSSGAAVALSASLPAEYQVLWRLLALAAAFTSGATLFGRFGDQAKRWADVAARWTDLVGKLRLLHLSDDPQPVLETKLRELVGTCEALQREDISAKNRPLVDACQADVNARHNGRPT